MEIDNRHIGAIRGLDCGQFGVSHRTDEGLWRVKTGSFPESSRIDQLKFTVISPDLETTHKLLGKTSPETHRLFDARRCARLRVMLSQAITKEASG